MKGGEKVFVNSFYTVNLIPELSIIMLELLNILCTKKIRSVKKFIEKFVATNVTELCLDKIENFYRKL